LSRKSYGILLSGRAADPEKGHIAIPPIFDSAFSYEKNIQSWEKVGAVPFTMRCLENRCVRREAEDESNDNPDLKLEQDLENTCKELEGQGYMGDAFRIKLKRVSENILEQRLPESATTEERVKAIVKGGVSLSSVFYTIGPSCLSTDEMFQAMEYKDLLSKHKKDVAAHKVLVSNKQTHSKAKELLTKEKPTVKDYQQLL